MVLAIDTKHLLEQYIPAWERIFNRSLYGADRSRGRQLQLHRVCAYATIIHDTSTPPVIRFSDSRQQAALDWQAEQGDDEDEMEVLHYLKQLAGMTFAPTVRGKFSRKTGFSKAGTTTLVASVQALTSSTCTKERPRSSCHRYSVRHIEQYAYSRSRYGPCWLGDTHLMKIIPNFRFGRIAGFFPNIVSTSSKERYSSVIWHVQLDFLEHSSRSTSTTGKRRRTLNPFHQVSWRCEEGTSQAHHPPDAKRFKGVRYRPERDRWVAEMKPPKSKNKVSFGEFQSQTEAARVVDVAFHHYGKLPLNFADTPQILSKQRTSAGLDVEAKRELVKEQTEWMKHRLPSLLSTESTPSAGAAGVAAAVPNSFDLPFTVDTSGLLSFSTIDSSFILGGTDETDDAVSQPQTWVQALMAGFDVADGKESMEQIFDMVDHACVVNESGDGQSMTQWSVENAIADPSDVRINPEHSSRTLTNVASSRGAEQPFGRMQSMCMDFYSMSPPPPMFPVWSQGEFQIDIEDGSLEQQSALGCE